MKTFSTTGTGGGQTLTEIETDKIPIYETSADADADLANLAVGQIIGIEDTGDELAQPVDVVEEGNLHAVTSNAVASLIKGFSAVSGKTNLTTWTCDKTGFYFILADVYYDTTGYDDIMINGVDVGGFRLIGGSGIATLPFPTILKKGDIISIDTGRGSSKFKIYGFYEFDIKTDN